MTILTHLMFDVETLSTTPDAVVLSLAVVPFEFENNQTFDTLLKRGFFIKFSVEEQRHKYKRSISKATVEWWSNQGKEIREQNLTPSDKDVTLEKGLTLLKSFIRSTTYDYKRSYVWSRGTYFDFPIIESLHLSINTPLPFNTWQIRDVRTYIDILCGRSDGKYELKQRNESNFIKHNCLCDAAIDAASLVEIYHIISEDE